REGPGPGHYNLKIPPANSITSCFQSRVPRFLPTCSAYVALVSLCGICQPRLSQQPGSGGSRGRCHYLISLCFLFCLQKTPGPGAYASSAQFPKQPRTIARMGREHCFFFNNTTGF
ncbi:hypothetical protein HPG69_019857, partial [Diceros bicornis minor]